MMHQNNLISALKHKGNVYEITSLFKGSKYTIVVKANTSGINELKKFNWFRYFDLKFDFISSCHEYKATIYDPELATRVVKDVIKLDKLLIFK